MKCLFCHRHVPSGAARCPHCGWDVAPEGERPTEVRFWKQKIKWDARQVIVGLLLLGVAVGLITRSLGSGDPSPRYAAREEAAEGFTALLEARYAEAHHHLSMSLRHDGKFAEAWLGRGMANLALGEIDAARHDAGRAAELFETGEADPQAWREGGGAEEGRLIAQRTACVAEAAAAAEGLSDADYGAVFRVLYEVRRHEHCDQAEAALRELQTEARAHAVVTRALTRCPELWRCQR